MSTQLKRAQLEWHADGTPVSNMFDDVYFSTGEGIEETQYVFLNGNHLPDNWLTFSHQTFTLGETGFGTGLNFLVAWREFNRFCQCNPQADLKRLRFVSVEKFPITSSDLEKAYASLPQLSSLADRLIHSYPVANKGCHIIEFDDQVTLELWFGDVHEMMPERIQLLDLDTYPPINAWFLDGFAPSKNPEMWNQALFNNLAKQSLAETTIATFTAAGFVRRGLNEAGFDMQKRKGFGRKREMLIGKFN